MNGRSRQDAHPVPLRSNLRNTQEIPYGQSYPRAYFHIEQPCGRPFGAEDGLLTGRITVTQQARLARTAMVSAGAVDENSPRWQRPGRNSRSWSAQLYDKPALNPFRIRIASESDGPYSQLVSSASGSRSRYRSMISASRSAPCRKWDRPITAIHENRCVPNQAVLPISGLQVAPRVREVHPADVVLPGTDDPHVMRAPRFLSKPGSCELPRRFRSAIRRELGWCVPRRADRGGPGA